MNDSNSTPLAERVRPQNLSEITGQEHLVGPGKVLDQMIKTKSARSVIFWGPPGVGKTTLAYILAQELGLPFFCLSAIDSGVKDVRNVIENARRSGHALLFIDELHRFNKAQQDSLLGAVEKGIVTLIGATTENPSFEVISALLSRCQVFTLKPLAADELKKLVDNAMQKDDWLRAGHVEIAEYEALVRLSGGDARKILNLLELVVGSLPQGMHTITDAFVQQTAQKKLALYDKTGDQHYDIISAFIKSMRGSDPNGAVYWLARMIDGGEDPKFIARRMLILASEDIGNANPNALLLATSCFQAVEVIGYPECRIILSQTAVYLACSAKSNATYVAIDKAQALVSQTGDLPVPLHLRNAPTKFMKQENYGKDYKYAHNFEGNFVQQEFLPDAVAGTSLYVPGDNPAEAKTREVLHKNWDGKYGY